MHFDSTILEKLGMPHALDAHPDLPLLLPEHLAAAGISAEQAVEMLRNRHNLITKQREAPIYYGYEQPGFKRLRRIMEEMRTTIPSGVIQILLMGGNRSGKTEVAAKLLMEKLMSAKGRRAWALQSTESASISEQQPYLWKYFPPEWKPADTGKLKKGMITNISYNLKTGFAGGSFVLPNESRCGMKYYASDVKTIEGAELDLVWADELIPAEWLDPLTFRLVTRNGVLLITFTPVDGYTQTVASFLDGAVAVESVEAELLPVKDETGAVIGHEQVPLIMSCREKLRRVCYFHTAENFYGGWEAMKGTLQGKSRDEIKLRAYGIAVKTYGAQFDFDDTRNVITSEACRKLVEGKDWTMTHIVDPAPGRNMAQSWWVTTPAGQSICVREWPQEGDYIPGVGEPGPWAVTGATSDGKRGPAQERFGLSLDDYASEIRRVERELGVEAFERFMDSRAGNSPTMRASEMTTLIQQFEELAENALFFEPAPGGQKNEAGDDWKILLNAALRPDKLTGAPRLMVAEHCRNTIFALKTWTGRDGDKGACKDFVDLAKYFILSGPEHVPDQRAEGFQRKRRQTGY
jgi:hypothetical protein